MSDNIEIPKYLYHYTNINTLALILKNRTIRFNRLDRVDDLTEIKTKGIKDFGKYCFVSCWTESAEESIPFWSMYTSNMSGVRIKMPASNLFKTYKMENDEFYDKSYEGYFKLEDNINNDYTCIEPIVLNNEFLVKIQYTDKKEKIYPNIFKFSNKGPWIDVSAVGSTKINNWSFQQEWRYKFIAVPMSFEELYKIANEINGISKFFNTVDSEKELSIYKKDLQINDEAFSQMEITMGPKVSEGDKIIVQALVEKYNKGIKVKNSVLEKTIR